MALRDKGFQFEVKNDNNGTTIFLKGPLDENAHLATLLQPPSTITFNFRDVTLLNSRGIIGWQEFVSKLRATKIILEECPTLMVRQMNVVPSFRGHAQVKSVYLAYFCEKCETEKVVLVDSSKFEGGKVKGIEPNLPCPNCKDSKLEPDTPLDRYFTFAR